MPKVISQLTVSETCSTREVIIRERLLNACVASVAEHGLHDLKMNHIIENSGISRRTVYKYFSNKQEIIKAAYHREGARLFEATKQEVAKYSTVEDIFVYSFLYVYEYFPGNPLLRALIDQNRELMESLNVADQTIMETIMQDIDLGYLFQDYPDVLRDIFELSEYWVQAISSFLLLGIGKNKTIDEIEVYIRKRFVPGLCLDDYKLD
jgi:AcrR family transcriptional regulator